MKQNVVCINLDTLALGSGWKLPLEKDPTYRLVDERLIKRLENSGIRATLFPVGKDLELAENRNYIKKWHRRGHEIGNHSYSHPLNLASLARREIEIEIEKTDKLIEQVTGKNPKSFNAPGWAVSENIDLVLSALNYRYDLSPFLSWCIYPLLFKQWWSLRGENISSTVWRRRDILYPLLLTREHVAHDKHLEKIPMPTVRPCAIPVWHTGWFIFGKKIFSRLLKSAIDENPRFYYLMHPADVIDVSDIPPGFEERVIFERLQTSLGNKIEYVDMALRLLT